VRIAVAGQDVLGRLAGRVVAHLTYRGTAIALSRRLSGLGNILVFHEIHDDPDAELQVGCSSRVFENLIRIMRGTGIDFVTMDEAVLRIGDKHSKPFVTVTFDDGYRDTYERALPILERFNVPFAIYVPTHAITRELDAWWLGLRMLFQKQDVVTIDVMNRRFSCFDTRSKIAGLRTVTTWVGHDFDRKDSLRQTFRSNGVSLEALSDKYFLSSEELREFARRQLVTVGAHSTSHAALSTLSHEDMEAEMSDNRHFLENLIGREVSHLAYPYGTREACGGREFAAARRLGFNSGTTAINRSIGHESSKHALPRLNLAGRFWTVGAERLAGAHHSSPDVSLHHKPPAERTSP